jgi:sugar lactone lactonase YvrE
VANTARKHIVRIPIQPDGSPGNPEITFAFTGPFDFLDGVDSDVFGNLYVALPARSEVAVINRDGQQLTTLATAQDGLDFPASVAVGEIRQGQQHVYVTSFAIGPSLGFPPGAGPSLMRIPVGVRP